MDKYYLGRIPTRIAFPFGSPLSTNRRASPFFNYLSGLHFKRWSLPPYRYQLRPSFGEYPQVASFLPRGSLSLLYHKAPSPFPWNISRKTNRATFSTLAGHNNYEWATNWFLDNLGGTKILLLLAEQMYRCGNAVVVVERGGVAIISGWPEKGVTFRGNWSRENVENFRDNMLLLKNLRNRVREEEDWWFRNEFCGIHGI